MKRIGLLLLLAVLACGLGCEDNTELIDKLTTENSKLTTENSRLQADVNQQTVGMAELELERDGLKKEIVELDGKITDLKIEKQRLIAADKIAPKVTGGTVRNGQKHVASDPINESGKIEVTFSEDVVKGEVALAAALAIEGRAVEVEMGTQAEWAGNKMIISLNAGMLLANETTYVITLKSVKDIAGNMMPDTKISFTTRGMV